MVSINKIFRCVLLSFIFCIYLTLHAAAVSVEPIAIYLTWQHAPSTTMTVQWISSLESKDDVIEYQQTCTSTWKEIKGVHTPFPTGFAGLIHRVELTGLTPDTEYTFRIGKNGQSYKFLTMPEVLKAPLRFVVGGDIYHDAIDYAKETNIQAAKTSPHFAILGGDIAYTAFKDGSVPEEANRWITWLSTWQQTMVTPEGRLVPMITAIGNHDTRGRYNQPPEQAAFYYALFPTPQNTEYRAMDFGNYLSLFILDSGHTHPIPGAQSQWLEEALKLRQNMPNKMAVYHVGAYPSVRSMNNKIAPQIRQNWVPIFDKYGLHAAFEHHDHAYKRTLRIKGDKEDPKGVVYIGDGAWGVAAPRLPRNQSELWFLAKTAPERHFVLVTIEKDKRSFTAINSHGITFDSYQMKD